MLRSQAPMSVSLDRIPDVARIAWIRLRAELRAILAADLLAMWAYGGTTFPDPPRHPGDLDTHVVLARAPDEETARRIEAAHDALSRELGVDWDTWYILAEDAGKGESPSHAFRAGRRDTAWALHRAHWLAGHYVQLDGLNPHELVPAPTWDELEVDLRRELEHIERHVAEGDDDPYEAAYAIFNGSRILHSLETGDVVSSKRSAGAWALAHLPRRWHEAIQAAGRAYDAEATPEDVELLANEMGPFVAMVRERLPRVNGSSDMLPRWSGF
jgi:hypothetical protein